MTLILGHASSDIGFLVADTLLSFTNARYDPRNPLIEKFHALKIQILSSDVAVAFAGDVELALSSSFTGEPYGERPAFSTMGDGTATGSKRFEFLENAPTKTGTATITPCTSPSKVAPTR